MYSGRKAIPSTAVHAASRVISTTSSQSTQRRARAGGRMSAPATIGRRAGRTGCRDVVLARLAGAAGWQSSGTGRGSTDVGSAAVTASPANTSAAGAPSRRRGTGAPRQQPVVLGVRAAAGRSGWTTRNRPAAAPPGWRGRPAPAAGSCVTARDRNRDRHRVVVSEEPDLVRAGAQVAGRHRERGERRAGARSAAGSPPSTRGIRQLAPAPRPAQPDAPQHDPGGRSRRRRHR